MSKTRYQIESHYRNNYTGEWVGTTGGVDGVSLWFYTADTDHDADD